LPVRFFISKELNERQKELLESNRIEFLEAPLIKTLSIDFDLQEVYAFKPTSLVFSSKNGVKFFFKRFPNKEAIGKKVYAVGPSTAKYLKKLGIKSEVPENFSAEGLIELLKEKELKEEKFLIIRPKRARNLLSSFLKEKGVPFKEVIAYETVENTDAKEKVEEFFKKKVDFTAFTSPSNFKFFLKLLPHLKGKLEKSKIIPIGHITEKAIKEAGLQPLPPPKEYTVDGIIKELLSSLRV